MLIAIIVGVVAFILGLITKPVFGSSTAASVEAELVKIEAAAVTDAKLVIAKIRAVL